ncbi:MAG: hypothetical protein KCHDKBKB_00884 [Elusimicrobia bacterium]|nr:hypothetical protein [Elusimicrobiota bacterium]
MMTSRSLLLVLTFSFLLPACKPTYKKDTLKESVKELARKEYKLDVDVQQTGKTLGLRFLVKDLITELYSGDAGFYKKMNGLFTVLARVVLSSEEAPEFMVLEIVDADNPQFRLSFTRYEEDLRKAMAEALSFTQSQDRMLEEFVVGGRRIPFDPQEMDLVRLMMMAIDSKEGPKTDTRYVLEEVRFEDFLMRVAENTLRRTLREKKEVEKNAVVREVKASLGDHEGKKGQLTVLLDLVAKPSATLTPLFVQDRVLPFVEKELTALFKSYRFKNFSGIQIVEENTGIMLTVPVK